MEVKPTITIELNREAILHMLQYVRGIYMTEHREQDTTYDLAQCPYCLTILTQLTSARDDLELQEKIHRLRLFAKSRQKKFAKG